MKLTILLALTACFSLEASPYWGAGYDHLCAVTQNGLQCWGYGPPVRVARSVKNSPKVFASGINTCAYDFDNELYCWGNDTFNIISKVEKFPDPEEIFFSFYSACVLKNKKIICWAEDKIAAAFNELVALGPVSQLSLSGYDYACVLTNKSMKCAAALNHSYAYVPEDVTDVGYIHAGHYGQNCAIYQEDRLRCWKKDQILEGPVFLKNPQKIFTREQEACALADGNYRCWLMQKGSTFSFFANLDNPFFVKESCVQDNETLKCFGLPDFFQLPPNLRVPIPKNAEPFVNSHHCYNLDGKALCFGSGSVGQLGEKTTKPVTSPREAKVVKLGENFQVQKIRSVLGRSCALAIDGRIACWGKMESIKMDIFSPKKFVDLALGDKFLCALDEENKVLCSGEEYPLLPAIDFAVDQIFAGGKSICLHSKKGETQCFGTDARDLPTADLPSLSQIAMGRHHTCGIKDDQSVLCWGRNERGQLARGNLLDSTLPAAALLGDEFLAQNISCGNNHCCASNDQKKIKCWGDNAYGQLGLGDTVTRGDSAQTTGEALKELQMYRGEPVTAFETFDDSTCATTPSGMRCWGYNGQGQLAQGDRDNKGVRIETLPKELPPFSTTIR